MSGGKGRSFVFGDQSLASDPDTHRVCIADQIGPDFTLDRFMSSAQWLDENVGHHGWCYGELAFHFKELEHAIDFRLRFVG